ncbi:MAG: AraC family transcriptional regulator [Acidimicrobiales bacterium]
MTAYSFVRDFDPGPSHSLCVDQHYLLCASRGVLRLEADGIAWTLPPARAALIEAGHPIEVTINQAVTTASVLVSTDLAPRPPTPLSVFDLTPLARALVAECARWPDDGEPLPEDGLTMIRALVTVAWALAADPSPARMPTGRSAEVRRALALTEARMAEDPAIGDVAAAVGLTSRALARRLHDEVGMTWRGALRRMRILRAIELLADGDRSVTEVAFEVGYASLSAFQAAFRDLMGQTPSSYRAGLRVDS